MIVGITSVSNWRQTGHWRSMYSTSVAGALALPSTSPLWGMPANCCAIAPASGSFVPVVVPFESEPPRETSTTAATATIATIAISAPIRTAGEALRPSVLRTGGRAACCRCRRACLPLVIARER